MSNKNDKDIWGIFKKALDMELGTKEGNINIWFTIIPIIMVIIYTAADVTQTIIYALAFHEKYPIISFGQAIRWPLIFGFLCMLYMVFMVKERKDFSNKLKEKKQDNE